ncbi:tail fiber domain-containing protein [bacterium]|nr:tail fiber domain-containing protein [bacterium]
MFCICSEGVWDAQSSRDRKENFVEINPQEILAKIDRLPITQWNFKDEDSSIKHIGPIAEDFHALFGLNGDNNKMIAHIDPPGVALAGIKALSKKLEAENEALKQNLEQTNTELENLKTENEAMKTELNELKAKMAQFESALRKLEAVDGN